MDRSDFMTDAAETYGRIHFQFDCAPAQCQFYLEASLAALPFKFEPKIQLVDDLSFYAARNNRHIAVQFWY